jgi:hypothetical protein
VRARRAKKALCCFSLTPTSARARRYYLLFDPQTSGGLLVTVDADTAEEMVGRMREQGYPQADIVGELVEVAAPPPSTSPDVCVAGPKLIRIAV